MPRARAPTIGVPYRLHVRYRRRAVTILRRAEGWLETIGRETGAIVRLAGFAPGAPSLENQVALR